MAKELESQWFEAKVIGKTTEQRGWLWKEIVYILAVRIPTLKPETASFPVPFDHYSSVEIGGKIRVKFYRTNIGTWATPKEYAEYLNGLGE